LTGHDSLDIAAFFNRRAQRYGDSVDALDWNSRHTQETRFRVLMEIGALKGRSVLDVGCGLADFYAFLRKRGAKVRYTGVDLSKKLIDLARAKHTGLDLHVADILREDLGQYDYVFASGIFYLKTEEAGLRARYLIRRMFESCRIGTAFNMLNLEYGRAHPFAEHVMAFRPSPIVRTCRQMTDYIVLRQDYFPNDFTVYLYREGYVERTGARSGGGSSL